MLSLDVLRISTRSFKNNRLRTMLTVLGISIGIGTIFFLMSLGYGFQKLILEKIATADSLLALDVTKENEAINLDQESINSIKEIENVSDVFPVAGQDAQIRGNGLTSYAKVNIVSPRFFGLEGMTTSEGDLFKEGEDDKMVISIAALQLLNIPEGDYKNMEISILLGEKLPSGDNQVNVEADKNVSSEETDDNKAVLLSSMRYIEKTYKIAGIIDDVSKAYLYVPDSSVSDMKFDSYEKLKVKINSTSNLEEARTKIIEKGFFVSSVSETVEQARQIFTIAQIILSLFGIVALVVSAIGMFNTMTIALLERTQEIGIMKSIGASSYDIWRMFLTESMLIGFFGGFTGVGFGFSLSQITNFGINWLARSFGGNEVQLFYIPLWFILFVITFSTVVGVITGFYPAKRAASLNALEALRYK